jgi:hypothetical protein
VKVIKWRGCGFFNKDIYAVGVLRCCAQFWNPVSD